ncbi:C3a anaphylatoxin chemotactic receptor-like [Sinocyclocheilus rhinocerous]|uniref:C3a anaphylatoxin chemotactic receptor-like n=1 Tax=Sinocyclocheilus rhinocerous TaxID=307959 RepID=UPI0007BA7EED|nr:PREDICTED: C3a anaphylatoxin chemotactic receptor-like [Sinocyclocheilus rhinocerous]
MADTIFGPQNVTRFITDNSTVQTEGMNVFKFCIYFAIPAVGLVGNGLIIFVTGYKMKTTVNSIWFLNLAIADFIFSLTLIISMILALCKMAWHFGDLQCKFIHFMIYLNMFASIFLLTTISLDRCLCTWMVVWTQNNRTLFKTRIICKIVWVLSIGCSIPAVLRHSTAEPDGICNYPTSIQSYKALVTYRFIVGFIIPFLIIASSYIAIGVRVKSLKKAKQLRSYRVIIAVVLAFFICWFPYHIHEFYHIRAQENQWSESDKEVLLKTEAVVNCLVFLNSCLNPILYVFMCDEYKKKLKQSLLLVLETAFAEDHLDSKQTKDIAIATPASCQDEKPSH